MSAAETLNSRNPTAADWPAPTSRRTLAAHDLYDGLVMRWMWIALAMQDIKLRYRGSTLGPFWLTISTLIMVVAMGVIYAHLLSTSIGEYIPYLTIGLVLWQFISTTITDGCNTFLNMQGVIHQVPMPFSIHAYRVVCRNLIVVAHSLIIVPFVLLIFHTPIDWHVVLIVPGFLLLCLNGVWVTLLLGMASARFRDIPPIVASFLQVVFFVTPIFWEADKLGRWKLFAQLNPLFAAVDVVRSPLIGHPVEPYSWLVMIATTLIGGGLTFVLFVRFRSRIAYWL